MGWVVVVAGEAIALGDVAREAVAAGASVGVVSASLDRETPATVRFRADPLDLDAWLRIGMHIEQHLGPIDAVVTDEATAGVMRQVFAADLSRRGRSPVSVVDPGADAHDVVTALCGTPPAAPSPPGAAPPDQ